MRVVTKLYIGLILWFNALNLRAIVVDQRGYASGEYTYAFLYGALLLLNLGAAVVLQLAKRHERLDPRAVRSYGRFHFAYVVLTLGLTAVISLIDQPDFGHLTVSTMSMLICSSFLLTDTREILTAIGVAATILFAGLPFFAESPDAVKQLYQELFAYIPISFAISRVLYKAYCDNYRSSVRLAQEAKKNSELNRRLQEANMRLEKLASVDELTGVANRRSLHTYLDKLIAAGDALPFAAIMIDIDQFKEYNDHYGHHQGDEVLIRVAGALAKIAEQTSGFVCRWGGEEFLYVARDQGREEILDICKRIHDCILAMEIPHEFSTASSSVTVSQGASSTIALGREDVLATIQQADQALYAAKAGGRNDLVYKPFPDDDAEPDELA